MSNKKKSLSWLKCFTVITIIFLYLPIFVLIVYSFNDSTSSSHFSGFSLRWYHKLFHNTAIKEAVKVTLSIGLLSSVISTIIATIGSYALFRVKGLTQRVMLFTNSIPIINPDLITGVGLFIFFIFIGIKLGFFSLLLAHISFSVPYAILTIYPRLRAISRYSIEAAYDLGASEFQTFWQVLLPQMKNAIISAFLICFTLSVDDFIISFFTTGNNVSNLSMLIYSIARKGVDPSINALSTLMFIGLFLLLFLINKKYKLEQLEG